VRQASGETLIDGSIAAVHLQCEPTVAAALAAKIPRFHLIRGRAAHRRVSGVASEALNEARILLQAVFVAPEIDRPTDARRGQKAKLTGTPSGAATRSSAGHAAAAVWQPPLDEASWAPIGTPAGIGPSWVCRLAATTSRRPVFRARATTPDLRRRLWFQRPESHRPGDSTLKSRARMVYKVNALEHTGAPCR
jgi:hypothetical protein